MLKPIESSLEHEVGVEVVRDFPEEREARVERRGEFVVEGPVEKTLVRKNQQSVVRGNVVLPEASQQVVVGENLDSESFSGDSFWGFALHLAVVELLDEHGALQQFANHYKIRVPFGEVT